MLMTTKQNKHTKELHLKKKKLNKKRIEQSDVSSVIPKTNFQFSVNLKHLTLKIYIRENQPIIKKRFEILLQWSLRKCLEIVTTQCIFQWSDFHPEWVPKAKLLEYHT